MKKTGFTLIELLLALTVFSVGMLSVVQVFPANRKLLSQTTQYTQASFLAQEQLEQTIAVPYAQLTVGTYAARAVVSTDTTSPFSQYERDIIVTLLDGNRQPTNTDVGLKQVTVTIYWVQGSTNRQLSLKTYLANIETIPSP